MPAITQPRTPCIAQLARELRYASKPTLLRHLARIDQLAPQIDPEGVYPEDWIVFRITAYRPDIPAPALVPGVALLADLSAVAESISEAAGLTGADLDEPFETIDSLARRWGVSRKSIERYRRLGLIARRIDRGSGRRAIVFLLGAVEWFESLHAARLGRAARFDRMSRRELARFERWARRYRSRLGWSRSRTAARIAARTGHSHEGVRKALLRIDRTRKRAHAAPIFTEHGPVTGRDREFALRAARRGIEPAPIAARMGRTPGAVRRAINNARADLMRSLALPGAQTDPPRLEDALDALPVRQARRPSAITDLAALIESMRVRTPAVPYEEHARARAAALLTRAAAQRIAHLHPANPSGAALDGIETDLRLAAILRALLIEAQLPLIASTLGHKLGGPIDSLDPARAAIILTGAVRTAAAAIDRYDPDHAGRLAAPISLAITRYAARLPDVAPPAPAGKATRRVPPGHRVTDWTTLVAPWQPWLDPDPRVASVLAALDDHDRLVLAARFGLADEQPHTRAALAKRLGLTPALAARAERHALRNALKIVRDDGTHDPSPQRARPAV